MERGEKTMLKKVTIIFALLVSICGIQQPIEGKVSDSGVQEFANVVLFAHFSDAPEEDAQYFRDNTNRIMDIYEGDHGRSFTNYMKTISYDKFQVYNIFPQYKNGVIESYGLSMSEKEAQTKNIDTQIIKELIEHIPGIEDQIVDYDHDGSIDNLTVIINGKLDVDAKGAAIPTMHPHKSNYPGTDRWSNKRIGTYNVLNTYGLMEGSLPAESGVVAHEFLHSLGYPDLYTNDRSYPVFTWDIMGSNSSYLQYPLAYTRMYFSNWMDIETITESQFLTLNLQSNKDGNQAYILQSPLNDHEFFVVEFRKKAEYAVNDRDSLDSKIGGSGILVYRINTKVEQLSNYHGQTGIYVFRPQRGQKGYVETSPIQTVQQAYLSKESGRTAIGFRDLSKTLEDGALTFSDGTNSGIVISNVSSAAGDQMTLDVSIPKASDFDVWENTNIALHQSEYDQKNIAMTSYNNQQYLVANVKNSYTLYRYDETQWSQMGSTFRDSSSMVASDVKLVAHNNQLYLGYINASQTLIIKAFDISKKTWTDVTSCANVGSSFDMKSMNGTLYLVYAGNTQAKLLKLENNSIKELGSYGTYDAYMGGQPKLSFIQSDIYTSIRNAKGSVIDVYKYSSNKTFTKVSDGSFSANTYDMISLENKIYLVLGEQNAIKMNVFDGAVWKKGNRAAIPCYDLVMSAAQGNLYLLATSADGNGKMKVYQYNRDQDTYLQEGLDVDMSASMPSLTSSNNRLYVGYVLYGNATSSVKVKAKKTADELLSIGLTSPDKTSYMLKERLDTTGLRVVAHYTKGTREIEPGAYTVKNLTTNAVGSYLATVEYNGKTSTFAYTVSDYNEADKIHVNTLTISSIPDAVYTKKEVKPSVTIKYGNTILVQGSDYTIRYANNVNAGTASLTIQGMGKYKGSLTKTFKIRKANAPLNYAAVSLTKFATDGRFTNPLTNSKGVKIIYRSSNARVANVDSNGLVSIQGAGETTITAKIADEKNYNAASAVYKLTVKAKPISSCKIALSSKSYTYTGKAIKPVPSIKQGKAALKNGRDFKISYSANKNTGRATIKIIGIGKYTGSKILYFYIVPRKVTVTRIKSSANAKLSIKYKKVTGASGYQIAFRKKGTGKWSYATVSNKTASKTLSKLSRKKEYQVKVRAYKKVGKTKYYGAYSKVKKGKVK